DARNRTRKHEGTGGWELGCHAQSPNSSYVTKMDVLATNYSEQIIMYYENHPQCGARHPFPLAEHENAPKWVHFCVWCLLPVNTICMARKSTHRPFLLAEHENAPKMGAFLCSASFCTCRARKHTIWVCFPGV